jgi:hypothetical protein
VDKKILLEKHNGSLWKLLKIYNTKGALYKGALLWVAISLDVIFIVITNIAHLNGFNLIKTITDLYISIIPSLLGFNLGAYALLIGLASTDLINKMSKSYETKFTSFQRASSVFGFCVLLQAFALIISFIFKLEILVVESATAQLPIIGECWTLIFNSLGLFVLNLFGIYSILILISVIGSIFAISQAAHFFAVRNHIKNTITTQNPPNSESS